MRILLLIPFVIAGWLQPAWADEPRTFCGKTVQGWLAVFRDKTSTEIQRRQSMAALGCFGPEAKAAIPDLIEALRHGQFKNEAVEALVQIGSGAELVVPILIERFLRKGCQHRTGVGTFFVDDSIEESLVRIGAPAVPALLEVLNGSDRDMRVCAAAALGKIGPVARAAVPSLIRTIEHPDTDRQQAEILRRHAIGALGRIGADAGAAVPVLNRHLDEALKHMPHQGQVVDFDGRRVTLDIAAALDRIGPHPLSGNCSTRSFVRLIRLWPTN